MFAWRAPRRIGGALRAPRRQSLLREQARYALLPAATPRMMGAARRCPPPFVMSFLDV